MRGRFRLRRSSRFAKRVPEGHAERFRFSGAGPRYTLAPLFQQQRDALDCADVDGLEAVRLVELQVRHLGGLGHCETHRADDVLEALADIGREIPDDAQPVQAGFQVLLTGCDRWRTVTLRLPYAAVYERQSDAEPVAQWMRQRGFLREPLEDAGELAGLLAVH